MGLVPPSTSSFSFFILLCALFLADTKDYLPARLLTVVQTERLHVCSSYLTPSNKRDDMQTLWSLPTYHPPSWGCNRNKEGIGSWPDPHTVRVWLRETRSKETLARGPLHVFLVAVKSRHVQCFSISTCSLDGWRNRDKCPLQRCSCDRMYNNSRIIYSQTWINRDSC